MIKLLILMTGIPGSGKSYKAQRLHDEAVAMKLTAEIHSTDDYFVDKSTGRYRFDPLALHRNHQKNLFAVEVSMNAGTDVLIVDNTNTTRREWLPYTEIAQAHGYAVKFAKSDAPWAEDPIGCHRRGQHGVPLDKIHDMHRRMQRDDLTKSTVGYIDHAQEVT